jgi:cell envelope opacity-associated protein A
MPDNINGIEPTNERTTQKRVIITKPSFVPISSLLFLVIDQAKSAGIKAATKVVKKIYSTPSSKKNEMPKGARRDMLNNITRTLKRLMIGLKAIILL